MPYTEARSWYRWQVVAMLWAISFFNYADRQAIFSVFPLLQQQMGLSTIQLGLLGSSFAWVMDLRDVCRTDCGSRSAKIGDPGRPAGMEHYLSLHRLCEWFPRIVRIARGRRFGRDFYYPASMSLISDYHGKATRSKAIGLHQTSVYVGTIAGGFFAGLIGQYYGWRWSFYVFGGLGIVLGVLLNRYLREPERGAADMEEAGHRGEIARTEKLTLAESLRAVWATPTALLLMAAFVCANFVAVVLLSWMPAFLYEKFHMSLAMSGLTATLFAQLASMVGSISGGWMADAWRSRSPRGRILVQAIGVFCGAPFVALCGLTQSVAMLIIALSAWGFFKGLYDANIFASVFDVIRPEARGTAAGFMNTVGWLGGGGAAPLVIGIIATEHGLSVSIALAAVVYIAAGLLLLAGAFGFAKRDVARAQRVIEPNAAHI